MLFDLHTHTYPQSDDSLLSLESLIAEAKRAGLDGLCLTEHDRFWDARRLAALSRKYEFLLLPGCEVTTEEGHLLVFGIESYTFGMHHPKVLKAIIEATGGVAIAAHPYRRRFRSFDSKDSNDYLLEVNQALQSPLFLLVHGIEILNGRASNSENSFAQELGLQLNLKGTGSSDAHD
jgi:predicted metal-dependent phosphoesterase TrpH